MEEESLIRPFVSVLASSAISARALRRKSLDLSGALVGFLVMFLHFYAGYRFGALLLAFFLTSSKLTKYGEEKKRTIDADFKEGGQRNWIQVLANSGIATVLVVTYGRLTGWQDKCLDSKDSVLVTCLIGGIIGHYACCNGDTWSSELGMLSNAQPRLITTFKPHLLLLCIFHSEEDATTIVIGSFSPWTGVGLVSFDLSSLFRAEFSDTEQFNILLLAAMFLIFTGISFFFLFQPVRKGTNGAVTTTGLVAAAGAGGVIGLTFALVGFFTAKCTSDIALKQLMVIPLAAIAGLCGSLIDSLLGATVQFSGFCTVRNKVVGKPGPTVKRISGMSILDNNGVNLVSVLFTTLLTSIACLYIF